jgi:hypothetical protein
MIAAPMRTIFTGGRFLFAVPNSSPMLKGMPGGDGAGGGAGGGDGVSSGISRL